MPDMTPEARQNRLQQLERLAWILDSAIRIPGTGWRIGLDGLIGLVPGIGDLSAGAISSYILWQAMRLRVSPLIMMRMALNVAFESVLGVIPFFGDLFDFAFRANRRNVRLLRAYLDDPERVEYNSTLTVLAAVAIIVGAFIFIVWAIMALMTALAGLVTG
ncbi:MAG TPA: DUF4112 domain-containing protein [Thiolinea sp.]|nr:DUF4112 domain-containing protein [Thiolinea sp.]